MMRGAGVSGGFSRSRGGRRGNSPLPVRGLVDGACCASKNAAGSDPIGGVGSGGVVELCLTFPLFHHSTLPLFHSSTHIATGGTPPLLGHPLRGRPAAGGYFVPVAHRMPEGALMSVFEKPPKPAPNVEKGADDVVFRSSEGAFSVHQMESQTPIRFTCGSASD